MADLLDFSGRTQLYYQVYDILYQDIKNGVYQPGELLPTENELIDKYNVSRVTVRKAMDLLMNDGLILKRRGYGTFVRQPEMELEITKVSYFAKLTEQMGYIAHTEVISNKKVIASKNVAELLGVPENTPLINLRRLRFANNIPVRMESAFLVYNTYKEVEKQDFTDGSLRQFLFETYGVSWSNIAGKIFAMAADATQARYLKVEEGAPILFAENLFTTPDGTPQELAHVYYRADSNYFSFSSQMT